MDQHSSPSDEEACAFATHVIAGTVLPAVLRSALELDLLELIKRAGPVSPKELATQIHATNPEADVTLDRILRLLAANDILDCRLRTLPHGGVEHLYSLTPLSKFLIKNEEGVSMAPMLLMALHKAPMQSWYHLKDAVVEGIVPFEKANGTKIFDYPDTDPGFNKIFNQAMHDFTVIFMGRILETYHGFDGLKTLVDVGGGIGASLRMILSKYPSIKAINFDLPHVIKDAPPISGVVHVPGDMFISVPTADAIFMKWICHDWSDDECVKLLKNCEIALSHYGKLIIADRLLSEIPKKDILATNDFAYDLIMLAQTTSGKERTEREFHALAKASGFKQFRVVSSCFGISIMELYK